jgi:hypothetical protein
MTYKPKPGDVGITTISGWGGRTVRILQWLNGDGIKRYAHAYVVTSVDDDGTEWIVEAMPGGARHVKNWHTDAVYLRCPDQYRSAVAAAALSLEGVPYAWSDYAAMALHRFHIPTPHLKRFIDTSSHMICSQLADRAAELGGWHIFKDHRWHGDVTPGDLTRAYEEQRAVRVGKGDMSR